MREQKFPDILSRFRNDVLEFSKNVGGVVAKKSKNKKTQLPRKQRRKLERKLKKAKRLAFSKREEVFTRLFWKNIDFIGCLEL